MTPLEAALAFGALLLVVDPVALAPVFAALIALAGALGHLVIPEVAAHAGAIHLALAAALAVVGAAMIAGRAGLAPGAARSRVRRNPALSPLAVPLIAGPGALGAMAMFAGRYAGEWAALGVLYGCLAAVAALTYAAFRASGAIARRMGPRGAAAVSRVLGIVLVVMAGRFLWEGLRDFGLLAGRAAA